MKELKISYNQWITDKVIESIKQFINKMNKKVKNF